MISPHNTSMQASIQEFHDNSFLCQPYGGVRITQRGCLARRKLAKKGRRFNPHKGIAAGGDVAHCTGCKVGEKLERGEG